MADGDSASPPTDPAPLNASPQSIQHEEAPLAAKAEPEMSEIEKIKAAHAARRSRRSRPPLPPSSSVLPPSSADAADASADASAADASASADADETQQLAKANEQVAIMRVELSSLRRNHLQNIKKITAERDMFAVELAKQQNDQKGGGPNSKKLGDVEAQLRASRTRNSDLELENNALRDEVKQLKFRVQASKTIDAASDGYNKVVDELVDAKLQCAQLMEEKEDLLRINKELTSTSAVLRNSNGDLEKSRSEWVLRCADVEKQRSELEKRVKVQSSSKSNNVTDDPSYSGLDLHELKL